jgi:hypothetical protein
MSSFFTAWEQSQRIEPPYARGSETSQAAAASVEPHVNRLEQVVLTAIQFAGLHGMTCDEVEESQALSHQTASARINGLASRRIIMDSGRRRRTRSERQAVVWVAT